MRRCLCGMDGKARGEANGRPLASLATQPATRKGTVPEGCDRKACLRCCGVCQWNNHWLRTTPCIPRFSVATHLTRTTEIGSCSGAARNPHVLHVHSGSCAAASPDSAALATLLKQLLSTLFHVKHSMLLTSYARSRLRKEFIPRDT